MKKPVLLALSMLGSVSCQVDSENRETPNAEAIDANAEAVKDLSDLTESFNALDQVATGLDQEASGDTSFAVVSSILRSAGLPEEVSDEEFADTPVPTKEGDKAASFMNRELVASQSFQSSGLKPRYFRFDTNFGDTLTNGEADIKILYSAGYSDNRLQSGSIRLQLVESSWSRRSFEIARVSGWYRDRKMKLNQDELRRFFVAVSQYNDKLDELTSIGDLAVTFPEDNILQLTLKSPTVWKRGKSRYYVNNLEASINTDTGSLVDAKAKAKMFRNGLGNFVGSVDFTSGQNLSITGCKDSTHDYGVHKQYVYRYIGNNSTAVYEFRPEQVNGDSFYVSETPTFEFKLYHSYWGDLNIYLESPDGRRATLHSRTSGRGTMVKSYSGLDADSPMAVFNSYSSYDYYDRPWRLVIEDRANGDTGSLQMVRFMSGSEATGSFSCS
ncbi:proprotein convertase P-domain-containing protein [Pseudobacteriovorax antillogorgiicola]|uniref:Proprotein convertase P-domain-containing protein n=1 Tax=Pseudobacteriovorax antillogorgiicola TaxID=1513793 RepID=A0A1Y6CMV1_9BACT|nr:proprotein convertase P-domain-containing protein [Pseudobacteriovorax antillogorgiicola]TCS47012.1 proprotein convertase P-domain-containing protein [Pseudobacteriovorax antillogorgiicola]SMF65064.1 Proprotein convertase P-domain-containing protein [Pseudobacteriovorax antillogorgiicola]